MFDFEEIVFPETMGASIHVPINPELLVWARESAGYDTNGAASRLGVSQEKLENIEAGEAQITYVQLRKAAEVYKRSLAAFFMAAPPPGRSRLAIFVCSRITPAGHYRQRSILNFEMPGNIGTM